MLNSNIKIYSISVKTIFRFDERYHHEIYLNDPRKCDINKLKTVIRHPVKKN